MQTIDGIRVGIFGDIAPLRGALAQGQTAIGRFAASVQGSMAGMSGSMLELGFALSALQTLPQTLFGGAVINRAADFESAIAIMGVAAQATGDDLERLTEKAREMGATSPLSAREAADAMAELGKAGLSTDQILSSIGPTIDLAVAANMGLADSAATVVNVMAPFQMGAEELSATVDKLAKVAASSTVDLSDLGFSFKYASGVAVQAGVSFEQLAAAFGVLANQGIKGSSAGTGMRSLLNDLQKPSAALRRQLQGLGIDLRDADGNLRPFLDLLGEFAALPDNVIPRLMLDPNAATTLAALLSDTGSLQRFIALQRDATGAAEEFKAAYLTGFRGQMEMLGGSFEELSIAIGESGVLGELTRLIRGFADFLSQLAKTNPELLRLGFYFAAAAAAIGPLLLVMGAFAPVIAAVLTPLGGLIAALVGAAGLTAALAISGNAMRGETQRWGEYRDAIEAARQSLLEFNRLSIDTARAQEVAVAEQLANVRAQIAAEEERGRAAKARFDAVARENRFDPFAQIAARLTEFDAQSRLAQLRDAEAGLVALGNRLESLAQQARRLGVGGREAPTETRAPAGEPIKRAVDLPDAFEADSARQRAERIEQIRREVANLERLAQVSAASREEYEIERTVLNLLNQGLSEREARELGARMAIAERTVAQREARIAMQEEIQAQQQRTEAALEGIDAYEIAIAQEELRRRGIQGTREELEALARAQVDRNKAEEDATARVDTYRQVREGIRDAVSGGIKDAVTGRRSWRSVLQDFARSLQDAIYEATLGGLIKALTDRLVKWLMSWIERLAGASGPAASIVKLASAALGAPKSFGATTAPTFSPVSNVTISGSGVTMAQVNEALSVNNRVLADTLMRSTSMARFRGY